MSFKVKNIIHLTLFTANKYPPNHSGGYLFYEGHFFNEHDHVYIKGLIKMNVNEPDTNDATQLGVKIIGSFHPKLLTIPYIMAAHKVKNVKAIACCLRQLM